MISYFEMPSHNTRQPPKGNRTLPVNGKRDPAQIGSNELYRIQVIDRAARILDCFTFDKPELSVSEVSDATGLHKSTAHRILVALKYSGFVEQSQETAKYSLGIKLFKLGHQAIARLNLPDIARPYLRALMEETEETVHLAVLDNEQVLYLDKVEGAHALRMPSRVGRHIPTYCTSLGKAMLSCLDESEVRRILRGQPLMRYTDGAVTNLGELLGELKKTRKQGYAVDNEETEVGLRCVGAPIRDCMGEMVGAVSVAGPSARLVPEKIPLLGNIVTKVASSISRRLGYEKTEVSEQGRAREVPYIGRP